MSQRGAFAEVAKEEWKSVQERNLLVVEDDPTLFRFWKRMASAMPGTHCMVVNSAEEALRHLENHPVDMLLTDLAMPGMDGLELMKRAEAHHPKMRMVATSGHVPEDGHFTGFQQFVHVIKKPYRNLQNVQELLSMILGNDDELKELGVDDEKGFYIWDL